ALIEKDWIQFGYKFTERCGLVSGADSREISPIFTQFLDCLRHLLEICPTKFEYNIKLLKYLHDQIYSAVYGTFIGCSEKERVNLKLVVGNSRQNPFDLGFVLFDTRRNGVPVISRGTMLVGEFYPVTSSFIVNDVTTELGS
ncbi:unnamed protein product, partial [Schistosoma curassoni]|uniref:Myotubularin phosphatase domain-containing protein n=1 Tax=Schistosoma curassoni TaxID=6186 RepID=A0A183JV90_9TREM